MIWLARALRIALIGVCGFVLSGIIPISLEHARTGNACPMLGPIPACYVVSVAYTAMAVAGLIWWRTALRLFLLGAVPVITLATLGTTSELLGAPTCPRAPNGTPLCYASLAIGLTLMTAFLMVTKIERRAQTTTG